MSISRQNLSVVIVSFMSDEVIHDCIKSIPKDINIVVVDNSGNRNFKSKIEKNYNNTKCILSFENLGMGAGNNLGLKHCNTDYALILNPDVILENNTIDELISASNKIDTFGIIAPHINSKTNLNYKLIDKKMNLDLENPFKVRSVDGFAMLLNIKKLNQIDSFKNFKFFDENIFLYLENDDLCKRVIESGENIYVVPKSKIKHLGAKAVDEKYEYEIELSRNWHWVWSKFYFNKKHSGYLNAFIKVCPIFFSASFKMLLYFFINNRKKKIYFYRVLGFLNAALGKKSFYRPKIND